MNVAIIGASNNSERISHKALQRLIDAGHQTFPVNPGQTEILGRKTYPNVSAIREKIHTVTMYVGPQRSDQLKDEILDLHPERIIFNPGAENEVLKKLAEERGIKTEDACTLVLLTTKAF